MANDTVSGEKGIKFTEDTGAHTFVATPDTTTANAAECFLVSDAGNAVLADGARINGVEFFAQDAAPTTRADTTALVADDVWYETDANILWFWNGTYWLSEELFAIPASVSNTNTNNTGVVYAPIPSGYDAYAVALRGPFHQANADASANHVHVDITTKSSDTSVLAWNSSAEAINTWLNIDSAINAFVDFSSDIGFYCATSMSGVPNMYGQLFLYYRLAHR